MLNQRVQKLERTVRTLAYYATASTLVLGALGLSAFRSVSDKGKVLRVRGLVIEDDKGRERILIGAPIPAAKNRVRTDLARVEKTWATRYPQSARYMEYYKGYRHAVNGLLVLDENGFDRLAIGDSVPDPNIGKRIGQEVGLVMNDAKGDERTGYGLLDVQGTYRVVLGLDSRRGQEGVALVLDDAGRVQMEIRDGDKVATVGTIAETDSAGRTATSTFGIRVREGKADKHRLTTQRP